MVNDNDYKRYNSIWFLVEKKDILGIDRYMFNGYLNLKELCLVDPHQVLNEEP